MARAHGDDGSRVYFATEPTTGLPYYGTGTRRGTAGAQHVVDRATGRSLCGHDCHSPNELRSKRQVTCGRCLRVGWGVNGQCRGVPDLPMMTAAQERALGQAEYERHQQESWGA